ncbi:STAS domain-containing protein [Aestuariimicrobium ganziense]|uniref:STAS domain-containing protein n=1 Tax=Aestuariimicrobium ganziense TaxID=2773677 RepID=UPI001F392852|nr:sodium-independent anion transporter [Aestuariimicrobium ganziense]
MSRYSVVRRQHLPADTREGRVDLPAEAEHLRERIAVYRIDGALFYGDARRFAAEVESVEDGVDVVIIRCHRMSIYDASGGEAMGEVVRSLRRRGIQVVVQGMTAAQVRTSSLLDAVPPHRQVRELSQALAMAVDDLTVEA